MPLASGGVFWDADGTMLTMIGSGSLADEILVVDDDHDVREVLAETLKDVGYDVHQAASADEALLLLDARPTVRMMITDVRMPGMSGLDLAEVVREQRADVKIIVMSGYFQPQPVRDRFLRKPFHMRELVRVVAAELGRSSPA